jgi:GMP synthase-like glutamine amidotransferase
MKPRKAVTRLYAIHNEQVVTPPSGAEILGHADNCPIASFRIGNQIFTTQHHPEITPDFMASVVEYMASELDGEVIRRAKASLEFEVDNDCFAEWMAKFLEGKTKEQ